LQAVLDGNANHRSVLRPDAGFRRKKNEARDLRSTLLLAVAVCGTYIENVVPPDCKAGSPLFHQGRASENFPAAL
jgi:hypothetical protein